MKLTQGGGEDGGRGRKGKETRGNRRGKDLNRIMARNDDGRFARAAVSLKLKRHLRANATGNPFNECFDHFKCCNGRRERKREEHCSRDEKLDSARRNK